MSSNSARYHVQKTIKEKDFFLSPLLPPALPVQVTGMTKRNKGRKKGRERMKKERKKFKGPRMEDRVRNLRSLFSVPRRGVIPNHFREDKLPNILQKCVKQISLTNALLSQSRSDTAPHTRRITFLS